MVLATALGVRGATILQDARVHALLVEAGVGVRTVGVGLALHWLIKNNPISFETNYF